MEQIELFWACNETGKKLIKSNSIEAYIEVNENSKELKNTKAFFRELLYKHFFEDWNKEVVLIDNEEYQIDEIKVILNELIVLINNEINALSLSQTDK